MKRCAFANSWQSFKMRLAASMGFVVIGAAGLSVMLSGGCATEQQTRAKAEDEIEHVNYDVKTVGDVSAIGDIEPQQLAGVGLVTGLPGTGGNPPPGIYRDMM